MPHKLLKTIPAVDEILGYKAVLTLMEKSPRDLVKKIIQDVLDGLRKEILNESIDILPDKAILELMIKSCLEQRLKPSLKRVINATGVVVHTNLGRSLMAKQVMDHIAGVSVSYSNLEFDLDIGERGSRHSHVEKIICEITGAKAAMVVNNNAAAVLLVLNTLSKDKEAIVSRGELVEIGGSFRIPEVMKWSGAILCEVGSTNRTHSHDYEDAINENTAIIMKVHQSNFEITGFTKSVIASDLIPIARKHNLFVFEDLGSGNFIKFSDYGLKTEPTVQETLAQGADVITFSGDKLLGGPQAGIIIGTKEIIDRCKANQIARALRIDKMTLAGLEATLSIYRDLQKAVKEIPTLKMITMPESIIKKRAIKLCDKLSMIAADKADFTAEATIGRVGGGALPTQELKSRAIKIAPKKMSASDLESALRGSSPPIIARIEEEKIILDLRTIQPDEEEEILQIITKILL